MSKEIVLTILFMTAVTYGARVIPFILLRNMSLGGFWKSFISLVPVALLAALVIPELLISPENKIGLLNPFLIAGISTFIFARKVPNLFYSVLFGMLVFWGVDKII
ncbi:MAG: branched-chain amino acid ABC transporter [Gracilibacter sp. BRH_c7a]|nr:MAG: branched-chain amino acid ABC transporter [Gracilibacter sp. BRH_c7a]